MAWLRLKTQQNLQRQNASWYVEIWANLGLFNTHKKICVYHITPLRMKPSFMNHHSCFGCWFLFFSNFICEHHSGFALWLICGVCTNTPTYYIWELFKQSFLWQKESMDAIKSRHQKSLMMVLVMCAFRDSITIRYEHLTLSRSQKLWRRSYDYWLIHNYNTYSYFLGLVNKISFWAIFESSNQYKPLRMIPCASIYSTLSHDRLEYIHMSPLQGVHVSTTKISDGIKLF